jgi:anti-sigma-K factor RskA
MTCQEFEELSGAYALDAVTPEEQAAAELHLAQCANCTRLYQELRSVVALLPLSVPQVNPPESLKERVLAAARREAESTSQSAQQHQNVIVLPGQRTRRQNWATRLLAAVAVLLFALLGAMTVFTFSLGQQLTNAEHQLTNAEQQLTGVRHQLANAETQLALRAQQLTNTQNQLRVMSPRLLATIKGASSASKATGQLYFLPQQNITILIMHGLPQPAGTRVYEGWLLVTHGQQITNVKSIGLLFINGNTASLSFPGNVTTYNTTAISLEPGPAASKNAPAGPVVASGSVKHST